MKQALTIFRRELKAYFTGPVGYIFIFVFLLFVNFFSLYVMRGKSFFEMPIAGMREYFHIFAGIAAFLVAAITMRAWSEERRENTFEMLLTLPMKPYALVLGKFMACFSFYLITLALTLTVPMMMVAFSPSGNEALSETGFWGLLDIGPVVSGYAGAVLLGALFISFGMFISSLCKDQIVAFVLTAPALFFAFMLGIPRTQETMSKFLDRFGENLGEDIGAFVGIFSHFDTMASGLVRGADILFFLVWIAIFIILNIIGNERRGRTNANVMFALSIVMMLVIGAVSNRLFMKSDFGRLDVTEDHRYTVDEITSKILSRLDDTVSVKYIVSPSNKLPPELHQLETSVRDKLESLKMVSGGKFIYTVIHQEAIAELTGEEEKKKDDPESSIKERLLKKIKPFPIEVNEGDSVTAKLIYSGIEISYKTKESEVIPQVLSGEVSRLEYDIIKYIDKMTREKKPVVALVAPIKEIDPQQAQIFMQLGRPVPPPDDEYEYLAPYIKQDNFDVKRVKLTKDDPLPAEFDVLVVVDPEELNDRQLWEINRALVNGKPVFMAVQEQTFNYAMQGNSYGIQRKEITTNVNRILEPDGVTVGKDVLMDADSTNLVQYTQTPFGWMPQPFPDWFHMHSVIKGDSLNFKHDVLQGIPQLRYVWGSTLSINDEKIKQNKLALTSIINSGPNCWTAKLGAGVEKMSDIEAPEDKSKLKRFPLGIILEGQFKDAFAGKSIPEWPAEPASPGRPPKPPVNTPTDITPAPGKLILIANARIFNRNTLLEPVSLKNSQWTYAEGVFFLVNCVNYLNPNEDLRDINKLKHKSYRATVVMDISDKNVDFWWAMQFVIPQLVIIVAGIGMVLYRKRRREAYAESLGAE
ncbi:MAG: Gldg family protein [Planctomycetes bacterium]|nr:Gldg family protein [Planctomycetota bacterium]